MDEFEEYPKSAKGMPVPAMMNIMSAIYAELAKDPVMGGPAMHIRQALVELDGLCTLARQVQIENDEMEQAASADRPPQRRLGPVRRAKRDNPAPREKNACLTPLASLQPHSFLKQ